MEIYYFTTQVLRKSLLSALELVKFAQNKTPEMNKTEVEVLESKLAPDMFPFVKQIQIVTDNAKGVVSRLSGIEAPKFDDTENTFAELIDRIDKTINFLDSIPKEKFAGASEQKIILPYFQDLFQEAEDYVRDYGIPNFFFHLVTAYNILRNQGFPVGKANYINGLNLKPLN